MTVRFSTQQKHCKTWHKALTLPGFELKTPSVLDWQFYGNASPQRRVLANWTTASARRWVENFAYLNRLTIRAENQIAKARRDSPILPRSQEVILAKPSELAKLFGSTGDIRHARAELPRDRTQHHTSGK